MRSAASGADSPDGRSKTLPSPNTWPSGGNRRPAVTRTPIVRGRRSPSVGTWGKPGSVARTYPTRPSGAGPQIANVAHSSTEQSIADRLPAHLPGNIEPFQTVGFLREHFFYRGDRYVEQVTVFSPRRAIVGRCTNVSGTARARSAAWTRATSSVGENGLTM